MKLRLDDRAQAVSLGDKPVLIGSHPRADIRCDQKNLHRRHALIAQLLDGWSIFDLRSRHGIVVNGEKVARHVLHTGDKLTVGPLEILVEAENEEPQNDSQENEDDHSWLDMVLSEPESGRSFSSRCRLDFYLNERLHRSVIADADAIIGTSVRAQIRLPRQGISSLHCVLAVDAGTWTLFDLRSDSGIVYDGEAVDWLSLHDGDEFRLGEFRVLFRLQPDNHDLDDSEDLSEESFGSVSTPSSGVLTDAVFDAGISSSSLEIDGTSDSEGSTPPLDAKVAQALRLQREREYEKAVRLLREVCSDAPLVLRYRKILRQAQIALLDNSSGGPQLTRKWMLWKYQLQGARWFDRGDNLRTLKIAEEGLSVDPWNRDLLVLEALVFEKLQMLRHCVWCLSTARKKFPEDVKLNRALAKIMQHLGEYDRAERYWKLVQKADPDCRDADRQIRAVLVQKTLQHNRYQSSDSWENLLEA